MTKKDHEIIARVLRTTNALHPSYSPQAQFRKLVDSFSEALSMDNPRFDTVGFRIAVYGYDPDHERDATSPHKTLTEAHNDMRVYVIPDSKLAPIAVCWKCGARLTRDRGSDGYSCRICPPSSPE